MFSNEDVLTIGRPGRAIDQAIVLFGYLPSVFSVRVHYPDVVSAVAIGCESDQLAVRAEARLTLPGNAAGEELGFAATDWHPVDVSQNIEDNLLTIRRDIAAHPGAFVGVELYECGRSVISLDIPGFILFLRILFLRVRPGIFLRGLVWKRGSGD